MIRTTLGSPQSDAMRQRALHAVRRGSQPWDTDRRGTDAGKRAHADMLRSLADSPYRRFLAELDAER